MATTDATADDRRAFVERVTQGSPAQIRHLAESNFTLAANILTYNWIEGNDRAGWPGKSFEWFPTPTHFEDWYGRIHAHDLNMFLAARKHTKTTFADCLMLWRSEFVDGHTSLYWANTENQVRERMEEFDEIVEANEPWLRNVHADTGLTRKGWPNGSRIRTTWVTGAAEGGHVDLSLGDDPMKEFADIPDNRIEEWYGKVIVPMLNPDGLHAIIGTRKRPNDLYELLRTKHEHDDALADLPSYTLTEYPAIREAWRDEYDRPDDLAPAECYSDVHAPDLAGALELDTDTLSVLWPAARPPEWLAKNLGGQGRSYFTREFNMIFRQAEDALVHRAWIQRSATDRAPPATLDEPFEPADHPEAVTRGAFEDVVVGIDPAGQGRDRFGFVTVGTLPIGGDGPHDHRRHILDVWQAQDVPPSRFRDKLEALHRRYRPDTIALESNLNQTWVADDDAIPREVRHCIETVATTRRKHSWKEGVPRIGSDIEAGRYRFYVGGDADNMTEDLITALTSIQMHDGELQGHTPDLVMALYMAHKQLGSPSASSSRTNLQRGTPSEAEREREATERDKRQSLRGSTVGDAILDSADDRWG